MLEMIEERKSSAVLEERRDLLSNLIQASLETNDSQKGFDFTHRDLLGNVFAFLLAGMLSAFTAADFFTELWSRSRDYGECFVICHSSSGNTSRGAGGAL